MAKHIKLLGALYLVFGAMGLCAVVALLGITLLGSGAAALDDPTAGMVLGTIGMLGIVIASIVTLPNLLAGWGLLKLKPWARVLTLVMSFLNLPAFPIGTAIGVYGIWVLFQAESLRLFEFGPPADLAGGGQQPAA